MSKSATVLVVDPVNVFVNCPFCDKVHVHGSNGNINESNYGTRLSHCKDAGLHADYELICDGSTIRKTKEIGRKEIEKNYGKIE